MEFLDALRQLPTTISVITRLRLDAALYEPAPERQAKQMGHPRKVGQRLATLKARLDACETTWRTMQILLWFRQRWQVEVTFEEVRAHLGVETQRQWSDLAILRTTPALFALFSVVVLWAHQLQSQVEFSLPQSAWYDKSLPTFVDALALVRQRLWQT